MMNRKNDYLGFIIVITLCMGILIPLNSLFLGPNHTPVLAESYQIANEGEQSQPTSNKVSRIESPTVDFSWSNWYLEYDNDSDGAIDTIEIFYEFSDFTIAEWVFFSIDIEILYWSGSW
ncbi:MAG: hypothetical protein ACW99F_04570, partial [Candidatus Hodarchaeales archaeon]